MRPYLTILPALAIIASCQQFGTAADAQPSASAASAAPAVAAAREVSVDNDLYTFEYSYPAGAGAAPGLRTLLDADLKARRKDLENQAREGRDAAREMEFPYNPYGVWIAWEVASELPDWISLSASVETYLGGAHPNHSFDTILWDRKAGKRRDAVDLFTTREALSKAIRPEFCRLLDEERKEKRDEAPEPGSDDPFDQCIDPLDSTVVLESSDGRKFDRILVLVAPYEAGPYVEGSYDATVPVTAEVMAAVKPEYRASFGLGK